jgi:hypothetical protein
MITINFHPDGAYITGHDTDEICGVVSYAMWNCIENCHRANGDMHYYQSVHDPDWSHLGLTYINFNESCHEHITEFNNFKINVSAWVENIYPSRVKINHHEFKINWQKALHDAKQYHVA